MTRVSRSAASAQPGLFLAVLMSMFSPASPAQGTAEPHEILDPGWQQAVELLDGILTPEQQLIFNEIAFAAAVSNLCEGYSLESDKFSADFAQLHHVNASVMSDAELEYFRNHLMFSYGVAVGLFMAEGSIDRDGFCRRAGEHRDDPEIPHYWQ